MVIRPARAEDVPAIEAIVERAYGGYVERIGGRPGPMDVDHAARVHQRAVHVADDGGPIGVLDVEHVDDHLVIENVAVHPERQGAGVGRALLNFAEELARVFGVDTIRLHTHALMTENRALYAGRGFVETGRRPLDGGAGGELVLMAKRLEPPSAPH